MSSPEERVELVRRGYEAYNAGDLDAVLELFDPEIEVWASPDMLNAGTYRGHEGWLQWVSQWNDAWESFQMEVDEVVPVGEHHVVARIHAWGRGRGSGVEVALRDTGYVYDFREGRSVYLGTHSSFEEAMAEARDREGLPATRRNMSGVGAEERIELVRRGFQAYNAADLGAILALVDPDVVIESSVELMNAGTYRGHDGLAKWMGAWHDAWEDFQNTPEEIVPVGERHVVARILGTGRGRGSGVEVSREVGYTYEVCNGRAVYVAIHPTFEEAMADARAREGQTESEGAA